MSKYFDFDFTSNLNGHISNIAIDITKEEIIDPQEAAHFLDCRDADDLQEELEQNYSLNINSISTSSPSKPRVEVAQTQTQTQTQVPHVQPYPTAKGPQDLPEDMPLPLPLLNTKDINFGQNIFIHACLLVRELRLRKAAKIDPSPSSGDKSKKEKQKEQHKLKQKKKNKPKDECNTDVNESEEPYDVSNETYESFYAFLSNASPELLKLVLDSFGNDDEIALALYRLRLMVGITPCDPQLEYQFYYQFSFCTDEEYGTDDWENILMTSMPAMIDELFLGDIYLTSDFELSLVLLPSNMSEFETEFCRCNRILGTRLKINRLDFLNEYLVPMVNLDDKGQRIQFRLMEKFMKQIAPEFPNLSSWKLGNMLRIESYLTRFNWILDEIENKKLPKLVNDQLKRDIEFLSQFTTPLIVVK